MSTDSYPITQVNQPDNLLIVPEGTVIDLALALLDEHAGTQVRLQTAAEEKVIAQCAADMRVGDAFPPPWMSSTTSKPAPSTSPTATAVPPRAGKASLRAVVHYGDKHEAIRQGILLNRGKPLTTADKKNAARMMLLDPELRELGFRAIGRTCGLDGKTVRTIWDGLTAEFPQLANEPDSVVTPRGRLSTKNIRGNARKAADRKRAAVEFPEAEPPPPVEAPAEAVPDADAPRAVLPAPLPEPPADEWQVWDPKAGLVTPAAPVPTWGLPDNDRHFEALVLDAAAIEDDEAGRDMVLKLSGPVGELLAIDALLFLWVKEHQLGSARALLRAGGLHYLDRMTLEGGAGRPGRWLRRNSLVCLVAARGRPRLRATTWGNTLPSHGKCQALDLVEEAVYGRRAWAADGDGSSAGRRSG